MRAGPCEIEIQPIKAQCLSVSGAMRVLDCVRCQTEEYRVDCTTRRYRETLLQTYSCAPAHMRSYYGDQVT